MASTLKKGILLAGLSLGLALSASAQMPTANEISYPIQAAFSMTQTMAIQDQQKAYQAILHFYAVSGQTEAPWAVIGHIKKNLPVSTTVHLTQDFLNDMAQNDHISEAILIVSKIESPQEKYVITEPFVLTLISLNRLSDADRTLTLMSNTFQKARLLSQLAQAYALKGQYDEAQRTCEKIKTPEERNAALYIGVRELATESPDKALSLAGTMSSGGLYTDAMAEVAKGFASFNRFEQALSVSKSLSPLPAQEKALSKVAPFYLKFGRKEEGMRLFRTLVNALHSGSCLSEMAAITAEQGDTEGASDLLAQLSGKPNAKALTRVGIRLIQDNKADRAFILADSVSNPEEKADMLKALSTEAGFSKQFLFALLAVKQINPEPLKNQCLELYIRSFATHGAPEKVSQFIQDLSTETLQMKVYHDILVSWLEKQKTKQANQLIDALPKPVQKISLWVQFSPVLGPGSIQKAWTQMDSITTQVDKALAYMAIGSLAALDKANDIRKTFLENTPNNRPIALQLAPLYAAANQTLKGLEVLQTLPKRDQIEVLAHFSSKDFQNEPKAAITNRLKGLIQASL